MSPRLHGHGGIASTELLPRLSDPPLAHHDERRRLSVTR